jgi:hypothetical protein
MYYINGGVCPLNNATYTGCTDKSAPRRSNAVIVPFALYFAQKSKRWDNKGVAFLDSNAVSVTIGKAYLITEEQFQQIHKQEGDWYAKILEFGKIGGYPVKSFTSRKKFDDIPPSEKYLKVITKGIEETFSFSKLEEFENEKPFLLVPSTEQSLLNPKSDEFKAYLSEVRAKIAEAKRDGTEWGGYINYSGCNYICGEFDKINNDVKIKIEQGALSLAFAVSALVLVNCIKLIEKADSSSGSLFYTTENTQEAIHDICIAVKNDPETAKYIFELGVKTAKDKAFSGWKNYAYNILRSIAILSTDKNVSKLEEILAEFAEKEKGRSNSSCSQNEKLVRVEIIRAIKGDDDAEKFIYENLDIDAFCFMAIENALAKKDYKTAEKLCTDRIATNKALVNGNDWYWLGKWYVVLYDIYATSGNENKRIETAEKMLVMGRIEYFPVLKKYFSSIGTLDKEYPRLLSLCKEKLPKSLYMHILSEENELELLFSEVKNNNSAALALFIEMYGEQLSTKYPNEIYELYKEVITKRFEPTGGGKEYRKICKLIKKMYDLGGTEIALNLIAELKAKYPRRQSLQLELSNIKEKCLTSKKVKKK